jgi:hypothetical protein
MIESKSTDSLASFLTGVSDLSKKWKAFWVEKRAKEDDLATGWLPWFRGEECATWISTMALQPKLYRNNVDMEKILDHEQEMRVEFRRRGAQLITERQPIDKWEWYFLMQHYRAPTRLLDWSDGALVGLHFAISLRGGKDDKYSGADAAVYMLDPWWLNNRAFKDVTTVKESLQSVGPALPDWDEAEPYLPDEFDSDELGLKCPLAIDPSHFSRRFLRRSREFTRVCSPKITYHLVSGVVVSTVFGGTGGPVWPELARAKQYETGHSGRFQPLFRPTKRFTRLRRG